MEINLISTFLWRFWYTGQFQIYDNTPFCLSEILHKHCFQFLLGLKTNWLNNDSNAYSKFWRDKKEFYGKFENGLPGSSVRQGIRVYGIQRSQL